MIDSLSWEDSLGDPSLLQKASFDIYHRHNYISNPGFEHLNLYRSTMSFTREVRNWLPASESPDLFISSDYAHSGNSFIGFRVFTLTKDIEYVQNQLKAPLKKDSLYCFSAYIQLSPGSKFASNAIGIKFSNHPMEIPLDQLYAVKADIQLESQILSFKSKWMRIECLYKAKGGEKWMILGSFKDHMSLKLTPVPGNIYESYYYLDDVSLVPVQDPSLCHCNFNDSRLTQTISSHADTLALDHLKVGETLVLRNIHFENDESELLPGSFATLMAVLEFLRSHPRAVVEISGHTSSTGDYEHNMDLSSRRAKAVQQFLVVNGVASERIKVQGYGPDKPIADNGTKEGQGLNRRVEFRLLKI
jgi:outer membrane protein OmpA-like peptidoglycan-associated protein